VEIDTHSPVPSYRQLAERIRAGIAAGEWRPREPIPSLHELVEQTGLSIGTVKKAVDGLKAEGLVYTVSGRGTFVSER